MQRMPYYFDNKIWLRIIRVIFDRSFIFFFVGDRISGLRIWHADDDPQSGESGGGWVGAQYNKNIVGQIERLSLV